MYVKEKQHADVTSFMKLTLCTFNQSSLVENEAGVPGQVTLCQLP